MNACGWTLSVLVVWVAEKLAGQSCWSSSHTLSTNVSHETVWNGGRLGQRGFHVLACGFCSQSYHNKLLVDTTQIHQSQCYILFMKTESVKVMQHGAQWSIPFKNGFSQAGWPPRGFTLYHAMRTKLGPSPHTHMHKHTLSRRRQKQNATVHGVQKLLHCMCRMNLTETVLTRSEL